MARQLVAAGKSTKLVYCGSSRQTMAFIDEVQEIMETPSRSTRRTSAAEPTYSPKSRMHPPEQRSTRADRSGSSPTFNKSP
ncbi:hypothetical protein [Arthrobacter crystallopoietes]|uniref:hypothetical protein n=1 Tax=Crystallibacter crystallopoietes TaxID=37928 RepID=UPI001113F33F|nr:hypothetical protein [Arthrobacter crystallopoietes]